MVIEDYNFNVNVENIQSPVIQEVTEVHNIPNMHDLSNQFVYKLMFIPQLGISVILCRKEIFIFNQTDYSLQKYDFKQMAMRPNLVPFCNYDHDSKMLNLVVSSTEKGQQSLLYILSFMISEDKNGHTIVPISKVLVHPSILQSAVNLISIEFLLSPGESLSIIV